MKNVLYFLYGLAVLILSVAMTNVYYDIAFIIGCIITYVVLFDFLKQIKKGTFKLGVYTGYLLICLAISSWLVWKLIPVLTPTSYLAAICVFSGVVISQIYIYRKSNKV